MNKTLYIKDEDAYIWDKARELSGDKLSNHVMQVLRRFVSEETAKEQGMQRIVLQYFDADGLPRAKGFTGRWLIDPESPFVITRWKGDGFHSYEVKRYCIAAKTAKGKYAVLTYSKSDEGIYRAADFIVVDHPAQLIEDHDSDVAAEIMKREGLAIEELDI